MRASRCSGEALQGRRDEFVVATKFGMDMQGANGADHGARGSRAYVRRAVEASLRRLRTDYLDLYQFHEPDAVTPIEETLSVLTDLVREGKVRYVGCSNVAGWQVADADWTARTGGYERVRLRPEPLLPARPHGRGRGRAGLRGVRARPAALLPARVRPAHRQVPPRRGRPGRLARRRRALSLARARPLGPDRARSTAYAEQRGVSMLDVAIAGLAAQPAVGSVISGATRGEQVRANAFALRWEPSAGRPRRARRDHPGLTSRPGDRALSALSVAQHEDF